MQFNKRKFFYFNNNTKHISFEISGLRSSPALSFKLDGDEGTLTFHIGFILGLWITFGDFLPNKWYPTYESVNHGYLPTDREFSIRFFEWSLWWDFWTNDDELVRKYPRWRTGSFDFLALIKGKHRVEYRQIKSENFIISFIEGNYQINVRKKIRYDLYKRAKTKVMMAFDVKAGMIQNGKWVDVGIPVMGKGSAAHNCGQDATYAMYFPAKTKKYHYSECYEAAYHFENQIKLDRFKNGGPNWVPKKHKHERVVILK